jgi:hypothetical protein
MPHHDGTIGVTLLTQKHCGFCEQAKAVLDHLAAEYALTFATLDLGTPEGQALALRGVVLFPPGVFLDGEPFSYGRLSERKLRRAIEQRLAARSASHQVALTQHSSAGSTLQIAQGRDHMLARSDR